MLELLAEGTQLDKTLHVATVLVALYLFVVSYRSYLSDRRRKFLYVCAAFVLFALKEFLIIMEIFVLRSPALVFGSHMLNFIILGLFFIGTVRK